MSARVALKVDVDTYRGTKDGVPALLDDLARFGVRASFFVSLGPDRSGLAVLRVLTKRGFLSKMLRTNPARMYGVRTMLYGTLLPAPRIGRRLAGTLRAIAEAGHEVGLHAWDHVRWQDRLLGLSPEAVRAEVRAGVDAFLEVFGQAPAGFAAPAWLANDASLLALEEAGLPWISVSRGRSGPLRPTVQDRPLDLIEVPTTLPTLDEALGRDGVTRDTWNAHLTGLYRPAGTEVLTIHAETEGLAFRPEMQDLLARHRDLGVTYATVGDLAREGERTGPLEERALSLGTIPGRAGQVALAGSAA